MKKYVQGALVANAASLGFHWIYNTPYLEALSKKTDLLFQKQSATYYAEGKPSYYVYPQSEVGAHTMQGMFLIWLYKALNEHKDLTRLGYADMLYQSIRPGGPYVGYVESYAKILIHQKLSEELKIDAFEAPLRDHHLVGFVSYLVCKELGLDNEKAWDLAQLFTTIDDYPAFYVMFDYIFEALKEKPLRDVLLHAINYAPSSYQEALKQAILMDDTQAFIKAHAGIACYLPQSIPLIFHILAHAHTFESGIRWNTTIGGASSDRGLLLGAIYAQISQIPEAWISKTQFK